MGECSKNTDSSSSSSIRDYTRLTGEAYGFSQCHACKNVYRNKEFHQHICVLKCSTCRKFYIPSRDGVHDGCKGKAKDRYICQKDCGRSFAYQKQLLNHICRELTCSKCGKKYNRE